MPRPQNLRWTLTGVFGKFVLWLMAKSCRVRVQGEEDYRKVRRDGKPVIILVWHGRILFTAYFFRRRGVMPLVSPSQDGEVIAQIVGRWGYKVLRGSSSHSIIRPWGEMLRELRSGGEVLIVPDGPRGPNRRLKLGCLKLAQETGAVLVPFTYCASRRRLLSSWDEFMIFRPFSRIQAAYGKPMTVDPGLRGEDLERERLRVEAVLNGLDESAEAALAGGPA